ncbi:MAG: HAD hydrolase family protein, partial [Candidatus Omnitrophica bacterium]|nr:HAD hydrolase family protein [Candidatus Omnitrophota bacterium]
KIEKDGRLIGAVVRSDHNPGETTHRFTNMEDPIQFNVMSRKAGIKGEKVYHTPVEGPNPFGDRPRQEVLFILKGKIKATFSTKENETVTEEILEAGDSVLFTEGHQVEFLEDTVFLEAKQGPYPSSGNKNDDQVMLSDNPESIYNELFSAGNSVELLKKLEKTKLAVFDLDETLANVDKDVPAGTIEELKSLLEKEINIAIVTGAGKFRVMPRLINKLKQSLGKDKLGLLQNLRVYTRLGNAGFGFNEAGEEVDLEETAIPDYQIENIKKIITASAEEIGIGEGINYKLTYKKEAKGNTLIVRIGFDDLANKKGDMHKMAQEIRKMFESEEIKLKVIESGEVAVEIAVNGKDYAIASLMDKLGVLADEIAFFGDSFGLNGGDRAMRFDATLKSLFFNVGPDIEEQELNEGILTSKVKGPSATEKILKLLIISKEQKIKDQIKKTPLKIDLKESLFNAKLREMVDMAI